MSASPVIRATEFEDELRRGADVLVIDTRDRDSYAAWHVDASATPIVNLPEAELVADPTGSLASVADDVRVRVICNAGVSAQRVAAVLESHVAEVRSVEGGLIGWSRVLQQDDVALPGPFTVVQFRREARGCLSYLVIAGGEALVVDPAPDVQPYLDEAARRGARICHVLDTHVHADHLSGARDLAREADASLHLSRNAITRGILYGEDVEAVSDGDTIGIGDESVSVIALPGHTTDMIGVTLGDMALIGGDSLFADSVARPDLEAGDDGAEAAARQLHRTLCAWIGPLPGEMRLLPCHYPGGRVEAPIAPTLADLREALPELSLDEDAFVSRVLSAMPPRPTNYLAIIGVNLGDELDADAAARLEIGANNCAAKPEWAAGGAPA